MRTRKLAGALVSVALAVAGLSPASAHPLPDTTTITADTVRVAMVGERRVPITLTDDVVIDLSLDGQGRPAGFDVEVEPGADTSSMSSGFGVAVVERGHTDGTIVAAMFGEDSRPMLAYGQESRLGLPRPTPDAVTCTRCELPAGDYDLVAFGGPWRVEDDDPLFHVEVTLEGIQQGRQDLGPQTGVHEFVVAAARHEADSWSSFSGFTLLFVFWFGDPIGPRDGVMLTEARVPAAGTMAHTTALRTSATMLNQDELPLAGEPAPYNDAYGADLAAGITGSSLAISQTSAVRTFHPNDNVLYHAYSVDTVGANQTSFDTAMLWLPVDPWGIDETDERPFEVDTAHVLS